MYATRELRDEHDGIITILDVLEYLTDGMNRGRPVNSDHLAQILDFLRTFTDKCHHGKEEDLLFPALSAAGIPVAGGPIGVMLADHDEGRRHIRGMADALERLRNVESAETDFVLHAYGYIHLLRAHIDKENNVLFMIAEQILPIEVHARLREEFARIEIERIGESAYERYHALIDTLRETYLQEAA